ncbi:dimethylarginine dimethylaminohydrolase family protein [Pseudonocardia sp. TRM90224]|uniref:dimethylarginine dimethylaminohydrolase family protein n=1 Tax=Pseudonocardia sp. TRM90224 TaxID=2812678 RepID=UPI001E293640|nr:arginine deiminase family protein [Pseudonocardia sp. TRM90224]
MSDVIEIGVTSDVGRLREVVVGIVKPATEADFRRVVQPSAAHDRLAAHNRMELQDAAVAAEQFAVFVDVLRGFDVVVHTVEDVPDVPLQLYPRDLAVVVDDVLIRTRSREAWRRAEQAGMRHVYDRVRRVLTLPSGTIEGGDVIVTDTDVLVGLGEETDEQGVAAFRTALADAGIERAVVPIEFAHGGVMHLDTKFTMASPSIGIFSPSAFTPAARKELEKRFDLIEATAEEARDVQVNTVALGPDTIVVSESAHRLAGLLDDRGITPIPIDVSEITTLPGSFRCATMPLVRG